MKKFIFYTAALLALGVLGGCKKEGAYPGGRVSPYISMFDLRGLYKGKELTLTKENLFGADKITGVVVSNHAGGNAPAGLLVLQDRRRLDQLRGIAVAIGADAAKYLPGDSVAVEVAGAVLRRVDGILQVSGVAPAKVEKLATGRPLAAQFVKANAVLASPDVYESTLIAITRAGFDAATPAGATYAGDRLVNDGFGNLTLHTEAAAVFAAKPLPFLANFTGIAFTAANGQPQLWVRTEADITVLAATAPKVSPIVITGYLADPAGTDANYEYIQLLATKDIDFARTPFSVVTTNNAGTATPTGFPAEGWATGGGRTYQFQLTSGTVQKGQYFYVGAIKNIWGAGSTDISASKWFGKLYATADGDGVGTKTTNLLANSGNVAGIAVFDKTTITAATVPVDVIFYGGAGSVYSPGPPEKGYRITDTDYYEEKNATSQTEQPYFNVGSNTGKFAFPAATNFARLGGKYNRSTGRWTTARLQTNVVLTTASTAAAIEGGTALED